MFDSRRKLTDEQRADVVRAYQQGETAQALAWRYEISTATVRHLVEQWRYGVFTVPDAPTQRAWVPRASPARWGQTSPKRTITCLEDLYPQIDRSGGPEACWPWTGALHSNGNPTEVKFEGRHWYADRLMYHLAVGEIPPRMAVDQQCGNSICMNPAHLYVREYTANHAPSPTRLPDAQRRAIVRAKLQRKTAASIAYEFGVSTSLVRLILKEWREGKLTLNDEPATA